MCIHYEKALLFVSTHMENDIIGNLTFYILFYDYQEPENLVDIDPEAGLTNHY